MPKQIDLGPHEYRRKGFRRFIPPHPLNARWVTPVGIACGIWAGVVIGVARYFLSGDNPWVIGTVALLPGAIWGAWLLLADRPDEFDRH